MRAGTARLLGILVGAGRHEYGRGHGPPVPLRLVLWVLHCSIRCIDLAIPRHLPVRLEIPPMGREDTDGGFLT